MIGCNLAYRDYPDFDAIVSIDNRASKYTLREFKGLHLFNDSFKTNSIFCNTRSYVIGELPEMSDKMDSGKLAAYLADEMFQAERLIMIGMDFGGQDLYTEGEFTLRPNFQDDWNTLLSKFSCVYRVGDVKSEACSQLKLEDITYKEFEELICA